MSVHLRRHLDMCDFVGRLEQRIDQRPGQLSRDDENSKAEEQEPPASELRSLARLEEHASCAQG